MQRTVRPEVPRAPPNGEVRALEDSSRYRIPIPQDGSILYLLYYEVPDVGTAGQGTHIASHVFGQVTVRIDDESCTEHRGGCRQYQDPARPPPPYRVERDANRQREKRRSRIGERRQ